MEDIFRRCHAGLLAVAQSRFRNAADADDVVQETYVRVLRNFDQCGGLSSVERWVFTICVNVIRDLARSRRIRRPADLHNSRETVPPPSESLSRNEDLSRIESAIADLEPEYRAPILLHLVYDLPQQEVAALLGVPVEHLRVRLFRAVRKIREAVGESRR